LLKSLEELFTMYAKDIKNLWRYLKIFQN
jgi:hypothetical protein